jgi:hypothetical protein
MVSGNTGNSQVMMSLCVSMGLRYCWVQLSSGLVVLYGILRVIIMISKMWLFLTSITNTSIIMPIPITWRDGIFRLQSKLYIGSGPPLLIKLRNWRNSLIWMKSAWPVGMMWLPTYVFHKISAQVSLNNLMASSNSSLSTRRNIKGVLLPTRASWVWR